MSFRDLAEIAKVSKWLRGDVGARFHYGFTVVGDAIATLMFQGVRARFPKVEQPDALSYIGRDRDIDRGPNESAAAFIPRLESWLDTHATMGHPRELLANVLGYLSPNTPIVRTVADRSIWDTISSGVWSKVYASSNWNWDGATQWWRAWVVIFTPSFGPSPLWGSFSWGDGTCYGTTASSTDGAALRNIVRKWRSGENQVPFIMVSQNAARFDPAQPADGTHNPDGLWGRPYKSVAGVAVPTRPGDVAFIPGVMQ